MKRYYDLSREELCDLSSEEIQNLIDLEIAYAGILPILEPNPPKLTDVVIEKNVKMYRVHGLLFKSNEDAAIIANMDVYQESYDYYGAGYDYKYAERRDNEAVTTVNFYNKDRVKNLRADLSINKELKDKYDKDKSEYDKWYKETSTIRDKVRGAINKAWEEKRELELAQSMFQKYLRLADNDEEIARTFFRDAYVNKPEIIAELFPPIVVNTNDIIEDKKEGDE